MIDCFRAYVVVLSVFLPQILGCGITTHLEVAYRAREHFELVSEDVDYGSLLRRHEDAFQSGASYPDSFYPGLCYGGEYHDIAEDTHWTPFLTEAVEYIRETYPRPWSRQTQKLVVFLLSIVEHQVSDATWHSLGIPQGFIQAMGKTNYHGSYGDAHSAGDFGGDVVLQYNMDTEYIGQLLQWYVPTEDLVAIYERYYGESIMTEEIIETCSRWIFLGRLGESIGVIELLYPLYARGSTFLIDRLNDYFLGGVDDMAVWVGNVWQRTVTMLNNGTDICDTPNNPIYIRCDDDNNDNNDAGFSPGRSRRDVEEAMMVMTPNLAAMHSDMIQAMEELIDRAGLVEEDVDVRREDGGMVLTPGPKIQKLLDDALELRYSMEETDSNDTTVLPSAFYSSDDTFARLGESLMSGDVNNDGMEDLIVSSPGFSTDLNFMRGAVHIIYGADNALPEFDLQAADQTLMGPELNGRFGTAVAVVDMNKDGVNDLAVSAPSVGSPELNYQGEVYVYYGLGEGGLSDVPDITIACQQRFCNLGWSMSGGDLDGDGYDDLVLGSPFAPAGGEQRGMLTVIYAKEQYQAGQDIHLTEEDFDWTFYGEQNYEWLGYSVVAYQSDSAGSWLAGGATMARICARPDCEHDKADVQAVGKVYVFQGPELGDRPAVVYQGTADFQQLGFHVTAGSFAGEEVLVISSATKSVGDDIRQAGEVAMYSLTSTLPTPLHVFLGDRPYGRFGAEVILADIDGDSENEVIISAPLRSESFRNLEEAGRAFVFSASNEGERSAADAELVLGMEERNARFGYSSAVVGSSLVFGAPHYNSADGSRLAGGLAVYNL